MPLPSAIPERTVRFSSSLGLSYTIDRGAISGMSFRRKTLPQGEKFARMGCRGRCNKRFIDFFLSNHRNEKTDRISMMQIGSDKTM